MWVRWHPGVSSFFCLSPNQCLNDNPLLRLPVLSPQQNIRVERTGIRVQEDIKYLEWGRDIDGEGKVFTNSHVHSIMKKKNIREQRFLSSSWTMSNKTDHTGTQPHQVTRTSLWWDLNPRPHRSRFNSMKKLLTILCLVFLSSCSQEPHSVTVE